MWDHDSLVASGFSEEETNQMADTLRQHMVDGGYSDGQIGDFFGTNKAPPVEDIASHIAQTVRQGADSGEAPKGMLRTIFDGSILGKASRLRYEAGRQVMKSIGIDRPKLEPEAELPADAGVASHIATSAGQLMLDAPFFAATAELGPTGGIGAVEGTRSLLTQLYKKGAAKDFHEAMDLVEATAHGIFTGGILGKFSEVGGETGVKAVEKAAEAIGKNPETIAPILKTGAALTGANIGMTAAPLATEGRVPTAQEFFTNAVLSCGFHGYEAGKQKLFNIYDKTGMHPDDYVEKAMNDPAGISDILDMNEKVPFPLQTSQQPTLKSDFVAIGDKLVPASDPKAQQHMQLEMFDRSNIVPAADKHFSMENREAAARAHDPEAFKSMAEEQARLSSLRGELEQNHSAIELHTEKADRANELFDLIKKSRKAELTPEEAARKIELEKTHSKDIKSRDAISALEARNKEVMGEYEKSRTEGLPDRIEKAWQKGAQTLRENFKDRIRNWEIVLPDNHPSSQLLHGYNPDFTPEHEQKNAMNEDAKIELMHEEQIDAFEGKTGNLTREEVLAHLMKDHLDVAAKAAPEITQETPEAATPEGETKPKVSQIPSDQAKVLKVGKLVIGSWNPKKVTSSWKDAGMEAVRMFFNTQAHLESLQRGLGDALPFNAKAADRLIQAQNFGRVAKQMIEDAIYDPTTNEKMHDGLQTILKKHDLKSEDVDNLRFYMVYKRGLGILGKDQTLEQASESKKSNLLPFTREEAESFVNEHQEKFDAVQKELTSWNNAMSDWAFRKGLITKEGLDKIVKENPDYTSLRRLTDQEQNFVPKNSSYYQSQPFKKFKGSEAPVVDPLASMHLKAYGLTRLAFENDARVASIRLHEALGPENGILEVRKAKGNEATVESKSQVVPEGGEFDDHLDQIARQADPNKYHIGIDSTEAGVYIDGEYNVIKYNDPATAELFKFIGTDTSLINQMRKFGSIGKFAATLATLPANAKRASISYDPTFGARHMTRQTAGVYFFSNGNVVDAMKNFMTALHGQFTNFNEARKAESEIYKEADRSGAFTGIMRELDKPINNERPDYLMPGETTGTTSRIFNQAKSIAGFNHQLIRVASEAQRLALYKAGRENLPPNANVADLEKLGWDVQRMFSAGLKKGAVSQSMSAMNAFMHYEMNGLNRYGEAWLDDPKQQAIRTSLAGTAVALNYLANKDDEYIQDQNAATQNSAVRYNLGGYHFQVQVPWTAGKLALGPQAVLKSFHEGNPAAFEEWAKDLAKDIPIRMSTDYNSWNEALKNNHDDFYNRPIIPQDQLDGKHPLLPYLQHTPYTTGLAKAIGETLKNTPQSVSNMLDKYHLRSPPMIDWIIHNTGGPLAELADHIVESNTAPRETFEGVKEFMKLPPFEMAKSIPILKAFVLDSPKYSAQPIQDWVEARKESLAARSSYLDAQKAGNNDEMDAILKKYPEASDLNYGYLEEIDRQLADGFTALRGVKNDKYSDPYGKVQSAEDLWITMRNSGRAGIAKIKEIRENSK